MCIDNNDGVTGKEILSAVEGLEEKMDNVDGSRQVSMIANRNISLEDISETWRGCFDWSEEIKKKLDDSFVIMRIQTEYQGDGSGHVTYVYMVKLKTS